MPWAETPGGVGAALNRYDRLYSGRRVGPASPCADGKPKHPLGHVKVVIYQGNYSAFNGYRFTPSDYSELRCERCNARWRTSAAYVEDLRD